MITRLSLLTAALLAASHASWSSAGVISNPSFETDSAWTVSTIGGEYTAGYTSSWASNLAHSFEFHRGTGSVAAGNYAQISQEGINLTGVTKFTFDCQDTGIDWVPLKFIVDDTQVVGVWQNNGWEGGVGSGWGHTAQTLGIEIPLATSFTGLHKLTIRMENNLTHYPADPKVYRIDNLQPVPEPSTLVLLGIAAIGLMGWAWRWRRTV